MARPSNTKQRRAQIAAGLMRAMAVSGYERASIRQIASEAGLASGVVHYHFESKLDILVALADMLQKKIHDRLRDKPETDPRAQLESLLDAHLALGEGADAAAVAAWATIGAEAITQPEVQAVYASHVSSLHRELKTLLLLAGCADEASADLGAASLVALVEGAYHVAAAAPGALPAGYAASAAHRLLHVWLNPS